MENDYFSAKKSSSDKYYYINNTTGKTQWGFDTRFHTKKRLPKGWIRLNYNGKPVYKYIGDKIPLTRSLSSLVHSPRELKELEIFQMSFEDLDEEDEKQQAEACRRVNLFKKVASLLKLRTESICDESLKFLAGKAKILPKTIIDFIEITELKQLEKKAILTHFSTIRRTDDSFSSERSIRELCGVNMREAEASKAMLQIEEELSCPIRGTIFKDPFTCSSGHTFERDAIKTWLQDHGKTCPATRMIITNYIVPNYSLRTVLEKFVEKYENQKGDIWKSIVESCLEYKNYTERLNEPEYVIVTESDSDESDGDLEREMRDRELELELERERRDRGREREREENQTGRTEAEIRAFMNDLFADYHMEYSDDIPEIVAQSSNSSYAHAIRQQAIRYNEPGRTEQQIRAFLINEGWSIENIQDIPEFIAQSRDSSYSRANYEADRRQR